MAKSNYFHEKYIDFSFLLCYHDLVIKFKRGKFYEKFIRYTLL